MTRGISPPTVIHPGDKPDSPLDGLLHWICVGGLRAPAAAEVLKNFRFFDQHRSDLDGQHSEQWVASLGGNFYANPNMCKLLDSIEEKPNCHTAYIEHMYTPPK